MFVTISLRRKRLIVMINTLAYDKTVIIIVQELHSQHIIFFKLTNGPNKLECL
jgi:hypothetical protein